jgi:hypothetical protein
LERNFEQSQQPDQGSREIIAVDQSFNDAYSTTGRGPVKRGSPMQTVVRLIDRRLLSHAD